jgi:hypothetical protein
MVHVFKVERKSLKSLGGEGRGKAELIVELNVIGSR